MVGGVRLLKIDSPPLNTLTKEVRLKLSHIRELSSRSHRSSELDAMKAYVTAYHDHNLAPIVYQIDSCPKPVVALVIGDALGGGLELALGCHYRICSEGSHFQFPEVRIGIIPGALGTQFLPRLASFETSLSMCVGCKRLTSRQALEAGIIDQIIPNGKEQKAVDGSFVLDKAGRSALTERVVRVLENQILRGRGAPSPFRRSSLQPVRISMEEAVAKAERYRVANPLLFPPVHKGGEAARGAVDALLAACRYGSMSDSRAFEQGALVESEISKTLVVSLQARALRYAFLAEREAAHISVDTPTASSKPRQDHHSSSAQICRRPPALSTDGPCPGRSADATGSTGRPASYTVSRIGVVGSGVMGTGIAASLLLGRYTVVLCDLTAAALARAKAAINATLLGASKRGIITPAQRVLMMAQLTCSVKFECLSECDVVIEAVFEDLKVKQELFSQLDRVCKGECILATNTSSLDVDLIFNRVSIARRGFLLGMHFFTPAHIMRLMEIVQGAHTSLESSRAALAIARRLGKVGVLVSNLPGFVGNRCIFKYALESMLLLEDVEDVHGEGGGEGMSLSVSEIDAIIRDFGFPMGPFEMADLSGLDVGFKIRKEKNLIESGVDISEGSGVSAQRYSRIGDELYYLGRLGMKNRKGFYSYGRDGKKEKGPLGVASDKIVEGVIKCEAMRKFSLQGPGSAHYAPTHTPEPLSGLSAGEEAVRSKEGTAERVVQRLLYPLINEAFKLLGEGGVVSARPGDIDIIFLKGYGWPAHKGGPLFYADQMVTLPLLLSRLERLWTQFPGSDYYSPSALLKAMVTEDVSILDLQKDHSQVIIRRLREIMASEHEGMGSRMLPAHRMASRL